MQRAGLKKPMFAESLYDTDAHGKRHLIGWHDPVSGILQFGYDATIFMGSFSFTPAVYDLIRKAKVLEVVRHKGLAPKDQVSYRQDVAKLLPHVHAEMIMGGRQQRWRFPTSYFQFLDYDGFPIVGH